MFLSLARQLTTCQRIVVVALALIPVVMVTAASVPALIVLPLLPRGPRRAALLIGHLRVWTESVLVGSHPAGRRS